MSLLAGDIVLLCSDGLTDLVQDFEIARQFQQQPLEDAISRLVDMANARGGHDNITLTAVQMPDHEGGKVPPTKPTKKLVRTCLVAILLGLLVGLLIFGGFNLVERIRSVPDTPTVEQVKPQPSIMFNTQETHVGIYPSETVQSILPSKTPTPTPLKATVTLTPTR